MRKPFLLILQFCIILGMVSCSYNLKEYQEPLLTFNNKEKISLPVQKIDIENRYNSVLEMPYVEHELVNKPAETFERLIQNMYEAAGQSEERLVFVIEEASVIESVKPVEDTVIGLFSIGKAKDYTARMIVQVQRYGSDQFLLKSSVIKATRTVTIPGSVTLAERDQLRFELIEGLMADMAEQVRALITPETGNEYNQNSEELQPSQ